MKRIVVVGGGAAGFFTAINIKEKRPDFEVLILEKTSSVLQKVRVSGGGRCNVTNGRIAPGDLVPFYPRGGKKLYSVFKEFGTKEMRKWLDDHSVSTLEEADHRVFPSSNSSQTIIDCFVQLCKQLDIRIKNQIEVIDLLPNDDGWEIQCKTEVIQSQMVVFAAGASGRSWEVMSRLGLTINPPVPSLFTFHIKDDRISDMPGLSFPDVQVKVAGSKLFESGPLLVTHWGLSGPAILKLSAWGARELAKVNYQFSLIINFIDKTPGECLSILAVRQQTMPKRMVKNEPLDGLPKRFWERIVSIADAEEKVFSELSKYQINKICEELTQGHYLVNGKSAFKEEFVTCGGISLTELNLESMECKRFPGLYMAGEAVDIDALTGGFNFQWCWSAGWLISQDIGNK